MNLEHARAISKLFRWNLADMSQKIAQEVEGTA